MLLIALLRMPAMSYSYFNRLNRTQKKIYLASDKVTAINLSDIELMRENTHELMQVLPQANVVAVEDCCQRLSDQICKTLNLSCARIHVLERRPHNNYGELHGLYEPIDRGRSRGQIYVWMRTAKRQQVVAFKTFLRTFIHELCHHLDYEYLKLADSFHTQGFFQRESSIYKQLVIN